MASVYATLDKNLGIKSRFSLPQKKNSNSAEDICRVCRGPSQPGRVLYHPCVCTGSIKYIHQDCLVQWLHRSGKKVCELCHHEFQFSPVYRPEMPRRLSLLELSSGVSTNLFRAVCRWLHLSFVALIWLMVVPTIIYRLYKFLMYDSLWSLSEIHLHMLTLNNILVDCFRGLMIVVISLIAFVSVVWLKDQLGQGIGRNWFDQEQDHDHINEDGVEPMDNQEEDEVADPDRNNEQDERAQRVMPLSKHVLALYYLKSQVDMLSEEQWKLKNKMKQEIVRTELEMKHKMNTECLESNDLLMRSRTKAYEGSNYDLNRTDQENLNKLLDSPFRKLDEQDLIHFNRELKNGRAQRTLLLEEAEQHSLEICKYISSQESVYTYQENFSSDMSESEKKFVLQIKKLKEHAKQSSDNFLRQESNNLERIDQDLEQQGNQRPNHHPLIGHAIAGLAREGDLEDVDDLTWARLLGLDGSFRFLEHVFWLLCLNSLLIMGFLYLPYQLGRLTLSVLPLSLRGVSMEFLTFKSVLLGYGVLSSTLLILYYCARPLNTPKIKKALGTILITVKVGIILILEAVVFPFVCGWWMDICSFGLFNSTLTLRQKNILHFSGASIFLHWLAGIIFIFYLASFVMLLREVLRPGVLWFLRNLNDQNFHPINEMINLPFQRHVRRFFMSCVLFGLCIVVILLLPTMIMKLCVPSILPYNLSMSSFSPYPIREVYVELILLQFVIPTLIEHGNFRVALKAIVQVWAISAAKLVGLQSYLLDQAQTGGAVVNVYGEIVRVIPLEQIQNGPVHDELQQLGAGFPPFKPYLRPFYFFFRILGLLLFTLFTVLVVSTLTLSIPVAVGRFLLSLAGITNGSEIYSAALGFYILLLFIRIVLFLVAHGGNSLIALLTRVPQWLLILTKCLIAFGLLLIAIPLCMGLLADMLLIGTLRIPLYKTPLFYMFSEWALGLLHTKCACSIIWLSNFTIKDTLDQIYNAGIRNLSLKKILFNLVWPVLSLLSLVLLLPYLFFIGILYHTLDILTYSTSVIFFRYSFPLCFIVITAIVVLRYIYLQCKKIYLHVRNQRYLVGQQLMNYSTSE